jgi:hypothetical protein
LGAKATPATLNQATKTNSLANAICLTMKCSSNTFLAGAFYSFLDKSNRMKLTITKSSIVWQQ